MPSVGEVYRREGPNKLVGLYVLTIDGTIYWIERYLGSDDYLTVEREVQGQTVTEHTVVRSIQTIDDEAVDVAVTYEELA